jgi:3-phenylpropionate/trans-cinnamate dioxygenase ferredoxin reductase subunit
MSASETIVIVGAGQAGGRAAETLRAEGFAGRIVMVGEESYPPYERPPLSKKVLLGADEPESTYLHDDDYWGEHRIEPRLGVRVEAIDREAGQVVLADGEALAYDRLLLATGARARRLDLAGAGPGEVLYLRGIDDALALRARLVPGAAVAVVGGGYIGLEVAAAARQRDCRVVVIEAQEVAMQRVVAPEIGRFLTEVHAQAGVDIRTGVGVTGLGGSEGARTVQCSDGSEVAADVVVVGVGALPNTGLAEAAGLEVDNGIVVNELGRTSDERIFAAGDVTNHPNALLGRRIRLESWQNAQNQAIVVARAMLGAEEPYAEVPWFWSDQYDLNLQMVGMPEAWDRLVLRGDPASRQFSAFYLQGDRMVGANAVNNARDIRPARQLIAEGRAVDAGVLADEGAPLRRLLKS